MSVRVFIDGEAGTTGLHIRERLDGRSDLTLLEIDEAVRKDVHARAVLLNEADIAILCLPDSAARESVSQITSPETRVIDASTAHRVYEGWVYGFPEMNAQQRQLISGARFVTNPGCYPTGMIALVRPLVTAGLLPADWPVTVNAVSGYSGGGKEMIASFEDEQAPGYTLHPFRAYALSAQHKHLPEMQAFAGLMQPPLFTPHVGRYYKGMLVEVPLPLWALPTKVSAAQVREVLQATYEDSRFVSVASEAESVETIHLDPQGLNDTNSLQLHVFSDEANGQARLIALLDNLGKGASGQAVQCLNIMIGADEGIGL